MIRALSIAVFVGLVLSSVSSAKTLEELLAEKGVITRSEAQSVTSGTAPKVFWNDGTRIEFPDNGFGMQITTQFKVGYVYTEAPEGQKDTSSFDVRSARLAVSGHALEQEFNYKMEYDARLNSLLDGFITWNPCKWADVKLGQFKTAISRQYVNNSFKLMFPDTSVASSFFSYGYQKAVKLGLKDPDGTISGGLSVTNGNSDEEGQYAAANDAKNMITGDIRWNPVGKMNAYEESDLNFTQNAALSFGAAYAYSPQENELNEVTQDLDVNRVSADANLKYRGLGVNAEYYVSEEDPQFGDSWTTQGAYLQAGYFLVPGKFEVAGRWSTVDCDNGSGLGLCRGIDRYNQATAGVNYYLWKYNLKAQAAYDYLRGKSVDDNDKNQNRWIFQLVGIF